MLTQKLIISTIFLCGFVTKIYSDTIELTVEENKKTLSEVVRLVNNIRTQGCQCGTTYYPPVAPLKMDETLNKAAILHSVDMYNANFFSHKGSNGSTIGERIDKVGYHWLACAENIAKNQETAQQVVTSWKQSVGHCKNMMNSDFDQTGIAKVGPYWTQVFAIK
nr:CAP domain-containing protein [uncultured Flavobacterium sp.]